MKEINVVRDGVSEAEDAWEDDQAEMEAVAVRRLHDPSDESIPLEQALRELGLGTRSIPNR